MTFTPEEIAAYVDGELDEAARARIMLAAGDDAGLAARITAQRRLHERLGAAFAPVLDQPVPPGWQAMIESATASPAPVASIAVARERRQAAVGRRFAMPAWTGAAIAASLVLGVFIGHRFVDRGPVVARAGGLVAAGGIADALDTQLASTQGDAPIRMLASFHRAGGDVCRTFSGPAASGIACHAGNDWHIEHLMPGESAPDSPYRQAGSPNATLMALAQDMAVGPPLDQQQERDARRNHWRATPSGL